MICALAARPAAKKSENSEIPGLVTQTSKEPETSSVPKTKRTPRLSSSAVVGVGALLAPPTTVTELTRSPR